MILFCPLHRRQRQESSSNPDADLPEAPVFDTLYKPKTRRLCSVNLSR